jgi:hypothetical protein
MVSNRFVLSLASCIIFILEEEKMFPREHFTIWFVSKWDNEIFKGTTK